MAVRRFRKSVLAIAVTNGAYISAAAVAQEAQLQLEEVTVTAQRREESLQEVPISAVAMNRDELDVRGIQSLSDIGPDVPNLYVNPFNIDPTAVRLFIRGIGQNDVQITQDPSVALYLDGVYVGTSFGSGFDGVDIEQVEVLRGPQGTLYGRNATGGAVNIVTRRAELGEWRARQDLIGGNLGRFQSQTVVNAPIGDRVALKFNYLRNVRDGYVENTGIGEDFGQLDRNSGVLDLRIGATDNFTIDYRYERAKLKDTQRFDQVTEFGPGALAPLTIYSNPPGATDDRLDKVASLRNIIKNDQQIDAQSLWLDWAISDTLTFKSITSLRKLDSSTSSDNLSTAFGVYSTPIPGIGPIGQDGAPSVSNFDTDFKQRSQEFQLLGDTPHWNYIAGLYFYDDEATQDVTESIRVGVSGRIDVTETENRSAAVYGQATWNPALMEQRWHFTFGARASWDKRQATRNNQAVNPPVVGDYDKSFQNFNPAFTLAYDITDAMNVYGKVVSGYKSGGTSNRSANAALFAQGFDEEEIINYELGYKSQLWGGRVRLNAAAFYMQLDGMQTSVQTDPFSPGGRDFLPVDGNTIAGAELDVNWLLSEGLTFGLGYGHLDTSVGEDSVSAAGVTSELSNVLPYAPKNSYTLALDYHRPLALGAVFFNVNYAWQDEVSTSVNVTDESFIDSYGLLGGAIGWSDISLGEAGSLRLMLWGKNLTDEEYSVVGTSAWSSFGAADVQTFGDPRTYGLTLTYEY
jgi:iron complex outermembrane receptor protein